MLIPSTISARRTRRYTSTLYIHRTIRRVEYNPMDDGRRYSIQSPFVSNLPPTLSTLTSPFTKQYANLAQTMQGSFLQYAQEVRDGAFPTDKESFSMDEDILAELTVPQQADAPAVVSPIFINDNKRGAAVISSASDMLWNSVEGPTRWAASRLSGLPAPATPPSPG